MLFHPCEIAREYTRLSALDWAISCAEIQGCYYAGLARISPAACVVLG